MNSLVVLSVIIGFILMACIPVLLVSIALRWGERTRIGRSNFWIAAIFSIIPLGGFVVIVLDTISKDRPGLLLGNMIFCIIGGLVSTLAVLLQGPLREYYAQLWLKGTQLQNNKSKK